MIDKHIYKTIWNSNINHYHIEKCTLKYCYITDKLLLRVQKQSGRKYDKYTPHY